MLQQSKTLPASQVQNNFGAIVKQVQSGEYKEIIVENRGKPTVAIIDIKELDSMKEFREQEKRKKALAQLRNLRAQIQKRIKGKLTEQEVSEIANRFSHEIVEDLAKEGKVRFERKIS